MAFMKYGTPKDTIEARLCPACHTRVASVQVGTHLLCEECSPDNSKVSHEQSTDRTPESKAETPASR